LVEEGTLHPDVLGRRIRLKLPESLPRAINPDDLRQILSLIWDVRDRAMILVLLRTGMRIGELLDTKVSDVNLKERQITILKGVKNRRGRIVYLSDDACAALKLWLKKRDTNEPYLFYGRGMKLSYGTARWIFLEYLRKAHLAHKGYSLHSLRHTFASELLNAGMRLECLQELLGHDSIEVTRRYARLTDKTREEEYFRAMEIIERGEIGGNYRLDSELQATLEEKELFSTHRKELPS
jgi:integrase/recombinase XerD